MARIDMPKNGGQERRLSRCSIVRLYAHPPTSQHTFSYIDAILAEDGGE